MRKSQASRYRFAKRKAHPIPAGYPVLGGLPEIPLKGTNPLRWRAYTQDPCVWQPRFARFSERSLGDATSRQRDPLQRRKARARPVKGGPEL